jgi:5-methylcytosine-specific restriction enzyme A
MRKKQQVESALGIKDFDIHVLEEYQAGKSCNQIADEILSATGVSYTPKGIAGIVHKFNAMRTQTDSFKNAITTGRMKYKTKGMKIARRGITLRTRYGVLERDQHRCTSCGSTELLEVDHVVAVRDGGKNEIDNLTTLCRACNIGKYQFEEASRMSVLDIAISR